MDAEEPDQKDVDAFSAWLDKIEKAPLELEKDLNALIEWLVAEKNKYLPNTKLPADEISFFENEIGRIHKIKHSLRLLDGAVTDAALKADIWHMVVNAFVAGINLGQYGEPIAAVKGEVFGRNARTMAADKAAKDAPIIAQRRKIIAEICKKYPNPVDGRKFADAISGEVNEKLRAAGMKDVSGRTIQRDIEAILKGCREI